MERLAVERSDVERDPVERDAVDREPVEREPLERLVVRDPLERDELELAFAVPGEAVVLVSAARSLSKSLSACLLVFAALRRRAVSPAVTSL